MSVDNEARDNRVRLNLVITRKLDETLQKLADANGTNKSEILRKALALYEVASEAKDSGKKLGILSKDRQVLTEIVGLWSTVLTDGDKPPPRTIPATIDLNDLIQQGQFDLSIRPAESEPDAQARRFRDKTTYLVATYIVCLVFVACWGVLLFGHPSMEGQYTAFSALSAIAGAALTTAFNKKSLY
jgi:hypothetical protein